ncbi:hypothetical protein KK101_08690 [Curtobacterium flaccumfaciens pv. oortii]|uniref:hypothetical protein n=1 Tax=Curtobacterium flaccumfaciens TaxID=2035 RepID=UPI001BDEC076|nr:hypothetical protein [Curtobacterium flaccumfaciens]MBT1622759.1 hypothetical protein [Curtobacterium flaccumfaciens pv. oortii]
MDTSTDQSVDDARIDRWVAPADDAAVAAWIADRCTTGHRHLVPVEAVGRTGAGGLVALLDRPRGTPLPVALDRLGTPTTGVAVTLCVPLLELLVAAVDGAVRLGVARIDDVLVDDAGAVVLCDRPAGAVRDGTELPGDDAARVLVLAARVVWDRVDPRDPSRDDVDAALLAALDGDRSTVCAALEAVRGAAPPRPFRWTTPPADLVFVEADPPLDPTGPAARLREVVELGIPLGAGRRLPLRHAVVGVVVAIGTVVAAVSVLGAGTDAGAGAAGGS